MQFHEKLGVLIPVHNAEETIVRSLHSVVDACKLSKVETHVTVVLNGCTDDTLMEVMKFSESLTKDSNIIIEEIYSEKGLVPALNKGLQSLIQKGCSLIARQDADDSWHKNKIVKQLAYLQEHKTVDILGTQINLVKPGTWETLERTHNPTSHEYIKEWLLRGHNPIAHPSVVFRTSILNKLGGYQDLFPMAEDLWLWSSAVVAGYNLANLPDVLVDYTSVHNPNYNPKSPKVLANCLGTILGAHFAEHQPT